MKTVFLPFLLTAFVFASPNHLELPTPKPNSTVRATHYQVAVVKEIFQSVFNKTEASKGVALNLNNAQKNAIQLFINTIPQTESGVGPLSATGKLFILTNRR